MRENGLKGGQIWRRILIFELSCDQIMSLARPDMIDVIPIEPISVLNNPIESNQIGIISETPHTKYTPK